jgi:hypothetical protein
VALIGLLKKEHSAIAAMRGVTTDANAFHVRRMILCIRGLHMAGKADPLLRHEQVQRGHVAPRLGHMTDRAGNLHGGVHGLTTEFVRVAGGAVVVFVENARMLDNGGWSCSYQYQRGNDGRNAIPSSGQIFLLASLDAWEASPRSAFTVLKTASSYRGGNMRSLLEIH